MKKHFYILGSISALLLMLVIIPDQLSYMLMKTMAEFSMSSVINTFVLPKLPWIILWLGITIGSFLKFKPTIYISAIISPFILIKGILALKINIAATELMAIETLITPIIYSIAEIAFCFWAIFILLSRTEHSR